MANTSNAVATAAAAVAAKKLAFNNEKKGKSKEQQDVLDFFASEFNGGGCGCLRKGNKTITIDEYMSLVSKRCNSMDFRQRAISKIGLDESQISEIPPICLNSFVYVGGLDRYKKSGIDNLLIKAENGQVVTSQYSITWLFFTQTQICTYTYIFDMTSDDVCELTRDFFYQDITVFSTESEIYEKIVSNEKGCFKKESYEKQNYVVDSLIIRVPEYTWSASMRNSPDMMQRIQAAKAMLREKKFSM